MTRNSTYESEATGPSSIENVDDETLMVRFQATGDASLMTTIFFRHKNALKLFLIRLSGSPDVAEEISQRAWLKLLEVAERRGYEQKRTAAFRTYLFTIARNAYLDEYRRAESRTVRADAQTVANIENTSDADPAQILENSNEHATIRAALFELPLEQREVLAFWAAGVEYAEIARITGASRDTVIGRKRYGIARLARKLEDDAK